MGGRAPSQPLAPATGVWARCLRGCPVSLRGVGVGDARHLPRGSWQGPSDGRGPGLRTEKGMCEARAWRRAHGVRAGGSTSGAWEQVCEPLRPWRGVGRGEPLVVGSLGAWPSGGNPWRCHRGLGEGSLILAAEVSCFTDVEAIPARTGRRRREEAPSDGALQVEEGLRGDGMALPEGGRGGGLRPGGLGCAAVGASWGRGAGAAAAGTGTLPPRGRLHGPRRPAASKRCGLEEGTHAQMWGPRRSSRRDFHAPSWAHERHLDHMEAPEAGTYPGRPSVRSRGS